MKGLHEVVLANFNAISRAQRNNFTTLSSLHQIFLRRPDVF